MKNQKDLDQKHLDKEIHENKSTKEKAAHKVGDALERTGEKLKEAGATKVGQKVYNKGDEIEHSEDDSETER